MAKVNISNVEVLDTESTFLSPFRFKITFECYEPLEEDLEWRLIYVSSAYNVSLDQTLDSILVGPIPVGKHQFVFEAGPPNTDVIPVEDAVGVTVVIVACLYRDQEFIRVGYYVNNEYSDEALRETPPDRPQYDKLARHILADNPRITRRGIDWGESSAGAGDPAVAAAAAAAAVAAAVAAVESSAGGISAGASSIDDQSMASVQQAPPQQQQQQQQHPLSQSCTDAQQSVPVPEQAATSSAQKPPPVVPTASLVNGTASAKENYDPGVVAAGTA